MGVWCKARLILLLDWADACLLGHRCHRVCCWLATHPFWDCVSPEQQRRYQQRLGLDEETGRERH